MPDLPEHMLPLPVGTSVRIDGLNAVQYNGKTGVVVRLGDERRVVELDGLDGKQMGLKMANLSRWTPDAAAIEAELGKYQGWLRKGQSFEDADNL
eukprot:SAG22_NODE_12929_length_424_cov_1.270769_1_plen_94_part_10